MRRLCWSFTILAMMTFARTELASAQTGPTIPAWAVGVHDCRVEGELAQMTWRIEQRDAIVIVDGRAETRPAYYPVGMLQFRGASDIEVLDMHEHGHPTELRFHRNTVLTFIVRRPDGSLRAINETWQCAPPGQQVPRLRSELELQQSPIRRPGGVDPSDLTRR